MHLLRLSSVTKKRIVWWLKVTLRYLDNITLILFLPMAKMTFVKPFFFSIMVFVTGLYFNLTLKMLYCMVILRRKYTWSNHLGLLLRMSPFPWFVHFIGLYMDLNSLLDRFCKYNNLKWDQENDARLACIEIALDTRSTEQEIGNGSKPWWSVIT
ncbi:hypothetical protein CR513_53644, partial [Mucuna pruriens]